MIRLNDDVAVRPVTENESGLWKEIFFDSVRAHFESLDPVMREQLLEFQFQAQSADYGRNYPNAANHLILFRDEPAGRAIVSLEHGDIHLIDFSVLTALRGKGIGGVVLDWLFEQSKATGLTVRFYVEKGNRAFNLYKRKGFETVEELDAHYRMEWRP